MSEKKEYHGASVEEAAEKASSDLGLSRDQLHFEVLDEGSTGFLGIGARDARITVETTEDAAKVFETIEGSAVAEEAESGEEVPSFSVEEDVDLTERTQLETGTDENGGPAIGEAPDELIVAVDEFMTALIDGMGLDATVDAYDAGDIIAVDVSTKETGLFIGRKGETIDAVQYLLNVVTYRDRPFVKKILVDSEGYRQRRAEAIQGMAHRTARRAVREQRSISLPPMSPGERRVVHLYLEENDSVVTSSEGQEEDRRVIVSPV